MNLYDLTQNALYLQELLENGDIDEQTYNDSLESLMLDDKAESICYVIRNLETFAAACKEEKLRLAKKQKTAENGVERLKGSLVQMLQATKNDKMTAGTFNIRLGCSKAVEVTAPDELPADYLVPQPDKIDLKGIGDALRAGIVVPGAEFKEKPYVVIK